MFFKYIDHFRIYFTQNNEVNNVLCSFKSHTSGKKIYIFPNTYQVKVAYTDTTLASCRF